jgi:polyphenol oxidase
MVRIAFPAFSVAFSERSDGDLRVSARTPGAEAVEVVQRRLLASLGVSAVAVGRQLHGTRVVVVGGDVRGYAVAVAEADGVVTAAPGVAAGVHVADCLPIAVGGEGGVAMLHGGWRGLAGGIVAEGVRALRKLGAAGPLQAAIGPGVGGCCYETGEEVHERFAAYPQARRGRLLDLRAIAAAQLHAAGVERVEDIGLCTICGEPGRLYSHRRDGAATGRQGGFAWLP